MKNAKKLGCSKVEAIKIPKQLFDDVPIRPKEGPEAIQVYKLTNYDKSNIAYEYEFEKKPTKIIKKFIKFKYREEYAKYEKYRDWDKCFIKKQSVQQWAENGRKGGNVKKPRISPKKGESTMAKKKEAELVRAQIIIDEIKGDAKRKFGDDKDMYQMELVHTLTSTVLADKMNICQKTANDYLNELLGKWYKMGQQENVKLELIIQNLTRGIIKAKCLYNEKWERDKAVNSYGTM